MQPTFRPPVADAIAAAASRREPFSPLRAYIESNFAALHAAWDLAWHAFAAWARANGLHGRRGPVTPKAARATWARACAARRVQL